MERKMTFLPANRCLKIDRKKSVLEVALGGKVEISHACGGSGTCGTCLVRVVEGLERIGPRNPVEADMARMRGLASHERLACQIHPQPGLVVEVAFS